MAPALIVLFYVIAGAVVSSIATLEMGDEVRLMFGVVGGIGALAGPIALYAAIDHSLTKRAIEKVCQSWCQTESVEFIRGEIRKNHFTVVFRKDKVQQRKKFVIVFYFTTWIVKRVVWLDK